MIDNTITFLYSTKMSPIISYLLVIILFVSFGKSVAEIVLLFEAHRNNLDELLISKDKIIYHLPLYSNSNIHDNMNDSDNETVSNETQRMIFMEDMYIV